MPRKVPGLFLTCSFLMACSFPPEALEISEQEQGIIGGSLETEFPAVGLVDIGGATCTGTLIAPDAVLTAAHCISNTVVTTFHITRFNENNQQEIVQSFRAKSVFAHPNFGGEDALEDGKDIGMIILEEPVPSDLATPMPFLREPFDNTFLGQPFLAIGYGISNPEAQPGQDNGSGIKRSVTLTVSAIRNEFFEYGTSQVNICQGDSGGPDIMSIDGVDTIVGVHSFGRAPFCRGTSASTRVDIHVTNFIDVILAGGVPQGNGGECIEDGTCVAACGAADPDCRCRQDAFCEQNCPNGRVDPDCCGADNNCNEACAGAGLSDLDCAAGGCVVAPEPTSHNPNSPWGVFVSFCALALVGLFVLRRRS